MTPTGLAVSTAWLSRTLKIDYALMIFNNKKSTSKYLKYYFLIILNIILKVSGAALQIMCFM